MVGHLRKGAVNAPRAADGDVPALVGDDQVPAVGPLKTADGGQVLGKAVRCIVPGVRGGLEQGAGRQVQFQIVPQKQRPAGVAARRHDHPAAALFRTGVKGGLDGGGVIRHTVAHGAESFYIKIKR